eukprot:TRINITY_DN6506_c0_g1_i1.p1 TRINITY_DN6506_c0_g1~~TRINITY_DN6506_c0_g1_i1.p1  ORF type:complete len:521 (+),score=162.80 TRINITY_DN6506_c0_g1_i1:258-1820(+)
MIFLGQIILSVRDIPEVPSWYNLEPRNAKDTHVKGQICIKGRTASKMSKGQESIAGAIQQRISQMHTMPDPEDGGPKILDLSGLDIGNIPDAGIIAMQDAKVQRVDLSYNNFTVLPNLKALNIWEINLSGNPITSMTPSVKEMTSLRALNLNGNQITEIPSDVGNLRFLEKLEISNNNVSKIANELGRCSRLEELQLSGNPISDVPPHIGGCVNLEVLDLSNCSISALPEEFTLCTRLMELNLGNNKLVSLPEGIGRMTRLVNLNVMDNNLPDLPRSLGYCVGLGKIGSGIAIARNPIKVPDMLKKYEIGVDHLLLWLEKRIALEGDPQMPIVRVPDDLWPKVAGGSFIGKPAAGSSGSFIGSPSSARKDAASSTKAEPPSKSVEEQLNIKVTALKNWCISTVRGELKPKVLRAKLNMSKPSISSEDAMTIAQVIRNVKAEVEKAKQFVPPRAAAPPPSIPPSDRMQMLKLVVGNTIDDIVYYLDQYDAIMQQMNAPNDVVAVIGVIKNTKPIVDTLPIL